MTPWKRSGTAAAFLLLALLMAAAPAATALNGLAPSQASALPAPFGATSSAAEPFTRLDGSFFEQDPRAFAVGDLDAVLERERQRLVQEHALRDEFRDVQEACRASLDALRTQAAQEESPLEREHLRDQRDTLVEECRERLLEIAERMRTLEEDAIDVRVDEPRFERLIELTRERLAVQDRLDEVREACARLEAPTRECQREQALLHARLQGIQQEESILESSPQAALFVDELRERRLDQQRAQEALFDVEEELAQLQAECEARAATLQARLAHADAAAREREQLQLQLLRLEETCERHRAELEERQAHLHQTASTLNVTREDLVRDLLSDERDSVFERDRPFFERGLGGGFGVSGGLFG